MSVRCSRSVGGLFRLDPCDRKQGMMLGTADPQGSLLGVDSLLSKLFEGDKSSFWRPAG